MFSNLYSVAIQAAYSAAIQPYSELYGWFYGVAKIHEAWCVLPLYNAEAVVYVTDENIWCGRKVNEGPLFNDLRSQISGSHRMEDPMAITSIC